MERRNLKKSLADLKGRARFIAARYARRGVIVFLVLAIAAIAFITFRPIINKPFSLDEVEEALEGWKMITVGAPAFMPVGDLPVSHPLLYTISHSLLQRVCGPGELPLRLYGVFYFLLSGALLALIIAKLLDKEPALQRTGMFIGCALYLLNPLLLQHSVVINSDNNILTSAILLFIYFFLRYESLKGEHFFRSRFVLALLLALCFWCKEMTPIFLAAGILAYRLFSGERKRFKLDLIFTVIAGVAVFWLTWWLYCLISGMDVLGFIKYTTISKSKMAFSSKYLSNLSEVFFFGFRWHLYWVSVPFFFALFMFAYSRIRLLLRKEPLQPVDCIFIAAMAIWLPFQFFRPNIDMMKYQYPAYPLFISAISWFFVVMLKERSAAGSKPLFTTAGLCALAAAASLLAFHYFMIGDYLLALWEPLYRHLNSHFYIYYYLPVILVAAAVAAASRRKLLFANLALAFTLLAVSINAGLCVAQSRVNYNTAEIYLNYGESGLAETIRYLGEHVKPGAVISVRQDLEYYLVQRYGIKINTNITPDKFFASQDERLVRFVLSQAPLDYLVVDKVSTYRSLELARFQLVQQYYSFERRFGDFYIFKKKES